MIELKEYQHSAVTDLLKQTRGLLGSSGDGSSGDYVVPVVPLSAIEKIRKEWE